jgi:hypothetical protein
MVFAAIAATLIIAIITLIVAALSGSSAMIAEVLQMTSIDEIVLHEGMAGRGVEKTASLLSLPRERSNTVYENGCEEICYGIPIEF